jgi:hypothetical protein
LYLKSEDHFGKRCVFFCQCVKEKEYTSSENSIETHIYTCSTIHPDKGINPLANRDAASAAMGHAPLSKGTVEYPRKR